MKVRIGNQSLRIRITPTEAKALSSGTTITTTLNLTAIESFAIELRQWNLIIGQVHTEQGKLIASVPKADVEQLIATPGYTFLCEQESGETQKPIKLEIEIDLQKAI